MPDRAEHNFGSGLGLANHPRCFFHQTAVLIDGRRGSRVTLVVRVKVQVLLVPELVVLNSALEMADHGAYKTQPSLKVLAGLSRRGRPLEWNHPGFLRGGFVWRN